MYEKMLFWCIFDKAQTRYMFMLRPGPKYRTLAHQDRSTARDMYHAWPCKFGNGELPTNFAKSFLIFEKKNKAMLFHANRLLTILLTWHALFILF